MDSLAEDLVLIAIDLRNGRIRRYEYLHYGITGAGFVVLAEAGHIDVSGDQIVVTSPAAVTGDPDLDITLAALAAARRVPKLKRWVGRLRRRTVRKYLTRLAQAGAIERKRGVLTRYQVIDTARAALLRARLDSVALGAGPADSVEQTYGALVAAVGLAEHLYRGKENRAARGRLLEVAMSHRVADTVRRAVDSAAAG